MFSSVCFTIVLHYVTWYHVPAKIRCEDEQELDTDMNCPFRLVSTGMLKCKPKEEAEYSICCCFVFAIGIEYDFLGVSSLDSRCRPGFGFT